MARSARLLELIQILRRQRRPVTALRLAEELGISVRSVYRDIATLNGQGVPVAGSAGVGYLLRPGFLLPPMTFTGDELEAVVLGLALSEEQGDMELARAAIDARAKIAAVLPAEARLALETTGLLVPPRQPPQGGEPHLATLRLAMREERRARLAYTDLKGQVSQRVVWPVAIGYFDQVRVLVAWCELRAGFRHFRTDRIGVVELLPGRYPRRRAMLLAEWQTADRN